MEVTSLIMRHNVQFATAFATTNMEVDDSSLSPSRLNYPSCFFFLQLQLPTQHISTNLPWKTRKPLFVGSTVRSLRFKWISTRRTASATSKRPSSGRTLTHSGQSTPVCSSYMSQTLTKPKRRWRVSVLVCSKCSRDQGKSPK
jgi:hypothetical protein